MTIQTTSLASAIATNTVAAQTAIDINAVARRKPGPAFVNTGNGNAVAFIQLTPGSTPGDFEIVLEQNETGGVSDTDYVTVLSITQANFKTVEFRNVTISERFVRLRVVDATANAGTVSLDILSA